MVLFLSLVLGCWLLGSGKRGAASSPLNHYPPALGDDNPEGRGTGWSRSGRGGQLGQGPAVDREGAHRIGPGIHDIEEAARGIEAGIEWQRRRPRVWIGHGGGTQQRERAIGPDLIARDGGASRVDREEILTVVRDLNPAGGSLVVGERGGTDGGQVSFGGHIIGGDGAVVRTAVRI